MSETPQKSNASSSSKKKSKTWQVSATTQLRKLGNREAWNLPGGISLPLSRRTRKKETTKPGSERVLSFEDTSLCSAATGNSSAVSSLTDTTSSPRRKYWKPPASRVIIEVNPIVELLEKYLQPCPTCGSGLALSFPTACIATSCRLTCKNTIECTYADLSKPSRCDVPLLEDAGSEKIERNTDHAVNVLYVISHLNSGNGGTEASRLLGLLGLPNSTTMQSGSFSSIEKELAPVLYDYAEEIMFDNLKEEVAIILGDRAVDEETGVSHYQLWLDKKLPEHLWPRMYGCADMGWQQKGSGRKRNSKSGHALVIAMHTRKAVAKAVCSKACGYCKTWATQHTAAEPPPQHLGCFINHTGSSGSMEPVAILQMYKDLYDKQVIVEKFVADDDSSMKAKLKWSNAVHMEKTNSTTVPKIVNSRGNLVARPDHGEVPAHMPEPSFVADPNHRTKTLSNLLYALRDLGKTSPEKQLEAYNKRVAAREEEDKKRALNPKKETKKKKPIPPFVEKPWNLTMTTMDLKRITKNFAFMARTLQYKETDQHMMDAGRSVLEHHFDNHEYCGVWCKRKVALQEQQQQRQEEEQQEQVAEQEPAAAAGTNNKKKKRKKDKFYRSKTKDAELYAELQSIIARFITLEALKELAHGLDTCANESFNNTVSWLAPKNKVYSGTSSLSNRICIALGITALGTVKFYEGLFKKLGIEMRADVLHYLTVVGRNRRKRLEKTKTTAFKKKRKAQEYERLKKETAEATKAREMRDGVYKPGIGMTGGYDLQDDEGGSDDSDAQKKPAAKKKRVSKSKAKKGSCRCGGTDHQRTSSIRCPLNASNKDKRKEVAATIVDGEAQPNAETLAIQALAEQMDEMDCLDFVDEDSSCAYYSAASEFS